jgi:hypothetical protein
VVKFDFIIPQMDAAMLARMVISPHHPHLRFKRNVASTPPPLLRFVQLLSSKEDRTNAPKSITGGF